MFRNLHYYRAEGRWPDDEEALSQSLESAGFEPCGPLTERSSGFVHVGPDSGDLLARRVGAADLLRLRSQSRVLPHAAVNEELDIRIDEYRERMREAPSPREKRRMKAEVRDSLLAKSMLKSDRIWGYFDHKEQVLGIGAAQAPSVERFLRRLQAACGDMKFRPLEFTRPFSSLLHKVFLGGATDRFSVGRECRMQDTGDVRSIVRWSDFDLSDPTIRKHVSNGMLLTHLELVYDNIMRFVLSENGVITKLKYLGMDDEREHNDDPLARLDAEFVLLTGTLRRTLADLRVALD
ncbi:MAG: recombination-associated protein RdgC [Gammaproteobacteria bacterium]|nr:recombination-associated protein RdgC [Gammaproteobacteria bacterium]